MNTGVKRIFGSLAVSSLILSCNDGEASPSLMQGGNNNAIVPYKGGNNAIVPYKGGNNAIVPYKGGNNVIVLYGGVQERADSSLGRVIEFRDERDKLPRLFVMFQSKEQCKEYELEWVNSISKPLFIYQTPRLRPEDFARPIHRYDACTLSKRVVYYDNTKHTDIVKVLEQFLWQELFFNTPLSLTQPIVELSFSCSSIGDKGCKKLSQLDLPNLLLLELQYAHISDEGVKYLSKAPFKKLKTLNLSGNKISKIKPIVYANWPDIKRIMLQSNTLLIFKPEDVCKADFLGKARFGVHDSMVEEDRPTAPVIELDNPHSLLVAFPSEETVLRFTHYQSSNKCNPNLKPIIEGGVRTRRGENMHPPCSLI